MQPACHRTANRDLEHEFAYDWRDPDCHLWFFDKGMPGYSWYVPKANGFLNVGIGGMAERIKRSGIDIRQHWNHLISKLDRKLVKVCAVRSGGL